jgi:hypothetical protein
MSTKQPPTSNCAECGAPLLERNRYFTGKFMTARDFRDEQDYIRGRQHLHNRMMHGWGIVSGLEVIPNPNKDCQSTTVKVRSGMALDCCGREVILLTDAVFKVPIPAGSGSPNGIENQDKKDPHEERLLCLYYGEQPIESMPAIYDDTGVDANGQQANRIRETASMALVRLDQVSEGCWQGGAPLEGCRDDCGDQVAGPAGVLLQPDCPCGMGVPLALLTYRTDGEPEAIKIDMIGRRHLPINADMLTHIVKTNWRHADGMTLAHLRDKLEGRLEIHFDRKIQAVTENQGKGISEFTFIVQYGGVQEEIRYLPYSPDSPPKLKGDCVAEFYIDPDYLKHRRDDLKDKVIYVALKCDFIPDCRGIPVDGAFLAGELPTHSGRMGGTFESWFFIEEGGDEGKDRPPGTESGRKRPRPRKGNDV